MAIAFVIYFISLLVFIAKYVCSVVIYGFVTSLILNPPQKNVYPFSFVVAMKLFWTEQTVLSLSSLTCVAVGWVLIFGSLFEKVGSRQSNITDYTKYHSGPHCFLYFFPLLWCSHYLNFNIYSYVPIHLKLDFHIQNLYGEATLIHTPYK